MWGGRVLTECTEVFSKNTLWIEKIIRDGGKNIYMYRYDAAVSMH